MKKLSIALCALMLILCSCGGAAETTVTTVAPAVQTTVAETEAVKPEKVVPPYERSETVKLSEVDFNTYGDRMDNEEAFSLEEFLPVLKNEASFKWQNRANGEVKEVTMKDFHAAIWGDNESISDDLMLYGFAMKNIDGVNNSEMVLDFADMGGTYLVLLIADDGIYGIDFQIRAFTLLESGLYEGSYGAAAGKYSMLMFDDGSFTELKVAEFDDTAEKYIVKGKDATKAEFDSFLAKYNTEPVNFIDVAK